MVFETVQGDGRTVSTLHLNFIMRHHETTTKASLLGSYCFVWQSSKVLQEKNMACNRSWTFNSFTRLQAGHVCKTSKFFSEGVRQNKCER